MDSFKNKQGLKLWETKDKVEVGLDECARGCLLGRTYTAAVIWSPEFLEDVMDDPDFKWIHKIKDSKKLSPKVREMLSDNIKEYCLDYVVQWADEKTIDQVNILNAVQNCFHTCLDNLQMVPDTIFVDGNYFKTYYHKIGKHGSPWHDNDLDVISHKCVEKGDNTYFCIASASILAKVAHDKYIEELCEANPELVERYDIDSNMGYGTSKHLEGIEKYGITEFHRRTFGICKQFA
jgi:ribonuclease HII